MLWGSGFCGQQPLSCYHGEMHPRLVAGLLAAVLAAWPCGDGAAENTTTQAPPSTTAPAAHTATTSAAVARPAAPSGEAQTAAPPAAEPAQAPSSVSCGAANRGALAYPAELPAKGPGYVIPGPWEKRGLHYGTEELVGLIQRAAATVVGNYPDSVLGVADLSKPRGGAAAQHRSHQSGRDVDLLYYALDPQGKPMPPDGVMPIYTRKGRAYYAESPEWTPRISERYFDLARNWALVKALVTDPEVEVMGIFVAWRIERWLIDYAKANNEPPELIHRAQRILSCPKNAKSHNDHMHVRIACSADDIRTGRCRTNLAPRRKRGGKWRWRLRCPKIEPADTPKS